MRDSAFQNAEKYLKSHSRRKAWYRVVTCLACVVVFCTAYALILPGITLEGAQCGIPEHVHSEGCYTQITSVEKTVPICDEETWNLHHHLPDCYAADGNPVCGYVDFVVHSHDSACYDEAGSLWCTLPEIAAHTHGEGCYALPEGPHTHGEGCYTRERGELACTEHAHDDACFAETEVLICTLEEQEGHQHGDACLDEAGELICAREVSEGHRHGVGCYAVQREQTCGLVSDHQHSDECYAWNEALICELSTEPSETNAEPVLICGKAEIILHEHTPDCLNAAGGLICGKTQALSHQHTELCFETVEEPVDPEALTCTLAEDGHTHTALCYGIWELTCDVQAHTHTEDCAPAEPTETTQPSIEPTEPSGMEFDSGLPVMGTAYASGVQARAFSLMALNEEDTEPEGTTSTLKVDGYITGATLYYRTEGQEWAVVPESDPIPGNAELKLDVDYAQVPIADLLAAGGKMTYTLPTLLRNAKTNGSITSGGKVVGTLTVNDGVATLAFDQKWLKEQEKTNTVISGDFYVEAEADLSQITDGVPGEIVVGKTEITINFDGDVIAKYGNVDLTKTVSAISEETDGDYLTYTLTVTAGQDGCPEVKVVDTFTDTTYIAEYVGVTVTDTNGENGPIETEGTGKVYITRDSVEKPGTLVWEIGDMKPGESRTLTYRVKLKEGYTGGTTKGNLQNTANVYSKDYKRDEAVATFAPVAKGTLSKKDSVFTPDGAGGGTIQYTIWVHADESNTYTLDNVKIEDALDGSIQGATATKKEIREHLSYDSFHLYQDGVKDQIGSEGLTSITDGTGPVFPETDPESRQNSSFTYNVGSLKPGESKTLVYTVKVEPGVFVSAGNEAVKINNRAAIYAGGSTGNENGKLDGYNTWKTLDRKAWSRKLAGQKLETADIVSMTGEVYDATGASVSKIDNPPENFTVPKGSYQYQVSANEAGDWDLSSASMTDSLGDQNMKFVGYVRVDAYDITDGGPASSLADAEAIEELSKLTPKKTVWVKVDGQSTFAFAPKDIGLTGKQAYLLTYYAQPKKLEGVTQVKVTNQFHLEGTVGIGDYQYTITGITAKADVLVEGSNSFTAVKQSWYYEDPQEGSGDFAMGALYWAIRVDGTVLPKGTVIRDSTASAGGETHYIRSDSLVGVYTGNLGGKITDYENLANLLESGKLTPLDAGSYTATTSEKVLQVTLDKDIPLEGNSLYLIVKTAPTKLPKNKRDTVTYNNKLESQYNSNTWLEHNVATKTLYGSEYIFKELGQVGTYVNGTWVRKEDGTKQNVDRNHLIGNGTYIAWQIHLNYEGNLSGRYRVEEQIPEGLELAYVRLWWLGEEAKKQDHRPCFVQLTEEELNALGGGWTEYAKDMNLNLQQGKSTNYYYTNGQTVIWDIANLEAGGEKRDDYAVEIQVVCRVTDPQVLLGGVEKDFKNHVTLYNSNGEQIGSDSDSVSIQKQTLSKTGTYNQEVNGGRYPFQITLNELGEDLVKGSDTITLVDKLSDTLTLDATTIKVFTQNQKGEQIAVDFTASVEGQTLKIILPDNLPLTITYETTVNAAPGQPVHITNEAHWEGYSAPDDGKVEVEDFSYTAGGTVGASGTPTVTVKKLDKNNIQLPLSGAKFQLVEMTYTEGEGFTPTEKGLTLEGTTDSNGTLIFGTGENLMAYNTIYCLTEIEAPTGYVLDKTPHYFAVVEQGTTSTFPEGVTTWHQGADYTYLAYNHKGEAIVTKKFQGENGGEVEKIDGTYSFGLYETEEPTGDPLQTVTITYANNTVNPEGGTAKFTNLELGTTYYVYELNDSGEPVISGSGTVSGKPFLVSYTNNTVKVTAENPTANVTVTNRVNYPELPLTGGRGTTYFYLMGSLLALAAGMLLVTRKRMGRSQ